MNWSMVQQSGLPLAIVLAGGLGTRLRSAVPELPKPMAPINGRPFLEYQLDYWISQGISEFILAVGYRREYIIHHFGQAYGGATIRYVVETTPLGTGGGLLLAVEEIPTDRPFLLLNGDTFFEVPLTELLYLHTRQRSDWTFSLFRSDDTERYMGMTVMDNGRISSLRSSPDGQSTLLANGGVYLIEPAILASTGFQAGVHASLEDDLLPVLQHTEARFFGYECHGRFIDIGVPHDYFRAEQLLIY